MACLEDALRPNGKREVFNSNQGWQFTTGVLKRQGADGHSQSGEVLAYYNAKRPHQAFWIRDAGHVFRAGV